VHGLALSLTYTPPVLDSGRQSTTLTTCAGGSNATTFIKTPERQTIALWERRMRSPCFFLVMMRRLLLGSHAVVRRLAVPGYFQAGLRCFRKIHRHWLPIYLPICNFARLAEHYDAAIGAPHMASHTISMRDRSCGSVVVVPPELIPSV
jgi:hypothetical protein